MERNEMNEMNDEIESEIEPNDENDDEIEQSEDTGTYRSGYRIYRDGTEREDFGSDR
jgi:hypothetical protein